MAAQLRIIFFFIQRIFFSSGPRVQLAPRDLHEDRLSRVKIDPSKPFVPIEITPCERIARNYESSYEKPRCARVPRPRKQNRAFKYNRFLNLRMYVTRARSGPLDALDRILLASMFRSQRPFARDDRA